LGDGENKRRRYCLMCNVFKPERCHHCSACNRCVLNMDHHCPWLNNCIGFYNKKNFLLTVLYAILGVFLGICGMLSKVVYHSRKLFYVSYYYFIGIIYF
jgi:palmitoyltransferase